MTWAPGAISSSSRAALHREGRIVAESVAHDEPARVAHESPELDRRHRVGVVEVLAGPALLPARDGAADGFLVEACRAREKLELLLGLDRPRVHQRVAAVRDLHLRKPEPVPISLVVEADPAAVDTEVAHGDPHLLAAVEAVRGNGRAPPSRCRPRCAGCGHRCLRCAAGGSIGDMTDRHGRMPFTQVGLVEWRGEVIVGEDEDGMLGLAASEHEGVGPGLVGLVGDAVEAREVRTR